MAWSISVAANSGAFTAVSPATVTHSGVAGHLYVMAVGFSGASTSPAVAVTTMTDTGGNTWTKREDTPDSGSSFRRLEIWYTVATSSFTSVTVNFTTTGGISCGAVLVDITGQLDADLIEASNSSAANTGTSITGVAAAIAEDDCLALAAVQWNSNNHTTITQEAGWTKLAGVHQDGPALAYRVDLASGANDGCNWTGTAAVGHGQGIVYFNMDPGAVATFTVSVWNGATEDAATMTVWNGATEDAAEVTAIHV